MSDTIIVAFISLLGTLGGSFFGVLSSNKLVNYKIAQLEDKVNKHNNLIERMYKCEEDISLIQKEEENIKTTIEHYHSK